MKRIGFGQVEPNHLSAQRTGQIYAQLPVDKEVESLQILENGRFVKYNYAENKVDLEGKGEWMLVFNEVKLYDTRETYRDFALMAQYAVENEIVPRVFKTNVGDIYTTNCLEKGNTNGKAELEMTDLVAGDELGINAEGYLEKGAESEIKFQVVKVYTLADGQEAVKVMRIA